MIITALIHIISLSLMADTNINGRLESSIDSTQASNCNFVLIVPITN